MPATEDILTPIHKAIRSMLFDLSERLQTLDFADPEASMTTLADLQVDVATAPAACILCLVHHHGGDEETGVFPDMKSIDPVLIEELLKEHHDVTRRLATISRLTSELRTRATREERIALGAEINREADRLFAFYLTHMSKEEVTLLPAMMNHFTDDQLRALRSKIQGAMPRDRFAGYMRWMLPSLNVSELTKMLAGMKRAAPPEVLASVTRIAERHVDPVRWAAVRSSVGL
ncbi:MAG: hemerythrin domain-containing protein [Thermoplasmata archaeon]